MHYIYWQINYILKKLYIYIYYVLCNCWCTDARHDLATVFLRSQTPWLPMLWLFFFGYKRHGLPNLRLFFFGHKHIKQICSPYYERELNSPKLIPTFNLKSLFLTKLVSFEENRPLFRLIFLDSASSQKCLFNENYTFRKIKLKKKIIYFLNTK